MENHEASIQWEACPNVRASADVDGGVLLDIDKGLVYSLNAIGIKIWHLIERNGVSSTAKSVVRELLTEFAISPERLASDVAAYLAELYKLRLIRPTGHGSEPPVDIKSRS